MEETNAAGLNLSKTCENALKSAVKALRKIYATNGGFSERAFAEQKGCVVRGRGFAPLFTSKTPLKMARLLLHYAHCTVLWI